MPCSLLQQIQGLIKEGAVKLKENGIMMLPVGLLLVPELGFLCSQLSVSLNVSQGNIWERGLHRRLYLIFPVAKLFINVMKGLIKL